MAFKSISLATVTIALSTAAHSAPIEWSVGDGGNGHYYEWVALDSSVTWHDANVFAQSQSHLGIQGHLASITSYEEDYFLSNTFTPSQLGYLGANDYEQNGVWKWEGGPEDGVIFQTGFGPGANHIGYCGSWCTNGEPNGDGNFFYYAPVAGNVGWINDWENFRGGAYIEYSASTSPVPVPAAVWLFGSGLLGLVGIARRKKA